MPSQTAPTLGKAKQAHLPSYLRYNHSLVSSATLSYQTGESVDDQKEYAILFAATILGFARNKVGGLFESTGQAWSPVPTQMRKKKNGSEGPPLQGEKADPPSAAADEG